MRIAQIGRMEIDIERTLIRLNRSRAAIKGWRTRRRLRQMEAEIARGFTKCLMCPRTIDASQDLCAHCWSKKHAGENRL